MKIVQILPFPPDFFRFRGGFSASEWRGMLPAAYFVCAERTVRYAAPPPPLRWPYLFCAGMARCASGGPFFSVLPEKNGEKRGAGERNSAYAQKRHIASAYYSPMARPARNALRAAIESGFPSARYAVQVVLSAPVEYLTYGSR